MNILLLSTGGNIGGEETFTRNLAISLISRGNKVWVAAGGIVQKSDLVKSNVPTAEIDISGRSLKGLYKGALKIRTFIRENRVEIVHCQAAGPAIMGGILKLMNRTMGEKWIYHDHGINKLTYKWLPFLLNRLDLTIANSDYELIKLKSNHVKDGKIVRIHNGIDPSEYYSGKTDKSRFSEEIRKELGISEKEFIIGYIGRLSPEKGCDLLLQAFAEVAGTMANVKLVIVGDGILRKSMEETVKTGKLSGKVLFTGFRSDIPKILCSLDTLILPSYVETFSLTTLQAMASGVPVIASDTGGNPEQVIHRFNGYLFETGNPVDLTQKIISLLNDPNGTCMGRNGWELIYSYLNVTRMVDEIEFNYRKQIPA